MSIRVAVIGAGQFGTFRMLFEGGTVVYRQRFDPEDVWRTVERERVTHTMLVPSQIVAILNAKRFDPSRFGEFPAGALDGHVAAAGVLEPAWRVSIEATVTPGSTSPK